MAQTFFPTFHYDDAEAAIDWLCTAFGFTRGLVVPGDAQRPIAHAELALDGAWIMLGSRPPADHAPWPATGVQGTYVAVDDVAAVYERASAAGAEVLRELAETDYGSQEFGVRDLEGHQWSFGSYRPAPPA